MSQKEVCRACLRSDGTMFALLDSIVPKYDSPSNFVMDLWKIFNTMLTATEDSFPDKICTNCLDEIHRTYSLMVKCERSEDILKKMKNGTIPWKTLQTISMVRKRDIPKNIQPGNYTYPTTSQIKIENIGYDQEDTIHANLDGQIDPRSEHTLFFQDYNFQTDVPDHVNRENDVSNGDPLTIQDIKQEPELLIPTENGEFEGIESKDESSTEIFACPGCRFKSSMLESLEQHIIDAHMVGQMCKLCNQEFQCSTIEHCFEHLFKSTNRKNSMYRVRHHTGKRQFKCESCSNTFISKQHLIQHKLCHTGERPFKCNVCFKAFLRKESLRAHLRFHTGERPFKCESCSKNFIRRQELQVHERCHTGERPFKCEICLKTFQRKQILTNHLRQHTGERPFKCESCSKTFRRKQYLLVHQRCHTDERPFKCEICSKTFQRKEILLKHVSRHT